MIRIIKLLMIGVASIVISSGIINETIAEQIPVQEFKMEAIDEEYFVRLMDAVKDRNFELLDELWVGEKNEKSTEAFTYICDYWDGREITSYRKISEEHYSEDVSKKRPAGTFYEYEIISGEDVFRLKFSITDEYKGGRYIDSCQFLEKVQRWRIRIWGQAGFIYGAIAIITALMAIAAYFIRRLMRNEKNKKLGICMNFCQ